jgi:two-component system cell cycle sensor histidine kinase PleC
MAMDSGLIIEAAAPPDAAKLGLKIGPWVYALIAFLPMALLLVITVFLVSNYQRQALEQRLQNTAEILAAEISEELNARINLLQVLALARSLRRDDLAMFYDYMKSFVELTEHGWYSVALFDPHAKSMISNTLRPFGEPLPYTNAPELIKLVMESKTPQIHGVVARGVLSLNPLIIMGIPVIQDGEVRYILNGAFSPQILNTFLMRHMKEGEGFAAIIDKNLNIAARSLAPEKFIGHRATDSLIDRLTSNSSGFFTAVTKEGQQVTAIYKRVENFGWTVVLGVPTETFEAPIKSTRMLLFLGAGIVVVMVVGAILILSTAEVKRNQREEEFSHSLEKANLREREALTQAMIEAETANRTKSGFMANMSHELRTPLKRHHRLFRNHETRHWQFRQAC